MDMDTVWYPFFEEKAAVMRKNFYHDGDMFKSGIRDTFFCIKKEENFLETFALIASRSGNTIDIRFYLCV